MHITNLVHWSLGHSGRMDKSRSTRLQDPDSARDRLDAPRMIIKITFIPFDVQS